MLTFRPISSTLFIALGSAFLFACGGDDGGSAGPCDGDSPPSECGATCSDAEPCAVGYYCDNGACTADCTPAGGQCDDDEECSNSGECVPSGTDGGDTADGGDGDGDGDGDGSDGGDDECGTVQVELSPVVPDVILLLDQSGSMNDPFGVDENGDDVSRWQALQDALVGDHDEQADDTNGLLFQIGPALNMGAALYTSRNGFDGPGGVCPLLISVDLAANNADAIADALRDNDPIEDTPTGAAVAAVSTTFPDDGKPHVIVLATDGLPDTCDVPDPETELGQNESEGAVQAAFDLGVTTFVLAVGPDSSNAHFQRLANVGQGKDIDLTPPDMEAAPVFPALNPAELADAFQQIGAIVRSCDINVEGTVDLNQADDGTVILNGETLEYGDDNDWVMVDNNTLRLLNDACETFKTAEKVSLSAEFPCGGVIVD